MPDWSSNPATGTIDPDASYEIYDDVDELHKAVEKMYWDIKRQCDPKRELEEAYDRAMGIL